MIAAVAAQIMTTGGATPVEDARPPLRERHTDLTRDTILRALVGIVTEGGLPDFSVQQVADRAGVSHRTIYRHYPSREDLLTGLMGWVEERMVEAGARFGSPAADGLGDVVRSNLAVFDELAEAVEAVTRFSLATGHEPPQRRERNDLFFSMVEDAVEGGDPEQVRAIAAVVRMLASTRAWLVLRQDGIASPEQVAPTLAWAVDTLLDAARAGRLP
jgi:AcrR family transcriptional regulator